MDTDWTDTTLTPAGQAIYISELPTGDLITPHDVRLIREEAVAEYGFTGLQQAQFGAAIRNVQHMPDGHRERHIWAHTTALFADPEGLL
jgi:hypothetical protein